MIHNSNKKNQEDRFWSKVEMIPFHECWEWTAATNGVGYGYFRYNGKNQLAHRVIFNIQNINIPAGMYIDHICRNRSCVNPRHLRIVTPRINAIENNSSITAKNHSKTQCINGHQYNKSNTYLDSNNNRSCKICRSFYSKNQVINDKLDPIKSKFRRKRWKEYYRKNKELISSRRKQRTVLVANIADNTEFK